MTYIHKLQNVLNTVLNRKSSFGIGDAQNAMYELDNLVMSQQLPLGASMDVSRASDRLKEVLILLRQNGLQKDIQTLLDDVIRLLRKAIAEAVGTGRGGQPPFSN